MRPVNNRDPLAADSRPLSVRRWVEWAAVSALAAGYCFVQIRSLLVPGICTDEALDGTQTQRIIHLGWKGIAAWPLASLYHAGLQYYLYVPFFLFIKRPEIALRTGELFFSLVVIALTYLCARRFFGVVAAIFTLIFLLANPVFIFLSRVSAPHGGVMAAFWLGALLCAAQWRRSNKDGWLFAAFFLMGAGFCVRVWFYWFLFGLALASGLIYWREIKAALSQPKSARRCCGAVLFLLLGLGPYLLKEALGRGEELFRSCAINFHYTFYRADNFALFHNFLTTFNQFLAETGGVMLDYFPHYPLLDDARFVGGAKICGGLTLALAVFCLLALTRGESRRKAAFFSLLLLGMFLPSMFTLAMFRQQHLFIIFPLPQIIMGAAASLLLERAASRGPRGKAAVLALLLLSVSPALGLREFVSMERYVQLTGGTGGYSDATEAMTSWLLRHRHFAPKATNWNPYDVVDLLSSGEISMRRCWADPLKPASANGAWFLSNCTGGDNAYVFYVPDNSADALDSYRASYFAALRRRGRKFVLDRTFYTRNGIATYAVYSIKKMVRP